MMYEKGRMFDMPKSRRRRWQPNSAKRRGLKERVMGNRMLKDFLVGTFGKVLQVALIIAGVSLLASGLAGDFAGRPFVGRIVGGVLCFCASFGIRYALGQIVRFRR